MLRPWVGWKEAGSVGGCSLITVVVTVWLLPPQPATARAIAPQAATPARPGFKRLGRFMGLWLLTETFVVVMLPSTAALTRGHRVCGRVWGKLAEPPEG